MAEQGLALLGGPTQVRFQYPKESKGSSGSGNPPKVNQDLKISDFDTTPDLSNTIEALPSRMNEYHAAAGIINKSSAQFNAEFQRRFMATHGGRPISFWQSADGDAYEAGLGNMAINKQKVMNFKNQAELEYKQLLASDLYKMESGEMLWDKNGDPLTNLKVLGSHLENAMKKDPYATLSMLGIDPDEAVRQVGKGLEELTQYARTNGRSSQLNREQRIQMQNLLPVGTSWDDTSEIPYTDYFNAMQEIVTQIGNAERGLGPDGKPGDPNLPLYRQDVSAQDVEDRVKKWHRDIAITNHAFDRVTNIRLAQLGDEAVRSLIGSTEEAKKTFSNTFSTISDIRDYFSPAGEPIGYDPFLSPSIKSSMIKSIEVAKDLSPEQKAEYTNVLSDQSGVITKSLLYMDWQDDGMLTNETKRSLFTGGLIKRDSDFIISQLNLEKKPYGHRKWNALSLANKNDWSGMRPVSAHEQRVDRGGLEISKGIINNTTPPEYLYSDPNLQASARYVQNYKGDNLQEDFWKHNKNSSFHIYGNNKAILNKFVEAVKKDGSILGGTFVSENLPGEIVGGEDLGITAHRNVRRRTDVNRYNAGIRMKGAYDFGISHAKSFSWDDISKSDYFKKWLKTQGADEYNQFYNVDRYMNSVSGKRIEDPTENAIQHAKIKGSKFLNRVEIKEYQPYSPTLGEIAEAGSVQIWSSPDQKNVIMPVSAIIVGEEYVIENLGTKNEQEAAANGYVHVVSKIVVSEDDLAEFKWVDWEGNPRSYEKDYPGGVEKVKLSELSLSDPAVKNYFYSIGISPAQYLSGNISSELKEKIDEMYIIAVPIRRNSEKWTTPMMEKLGAESFQRDEANKALDGESPANNLNLSFTNKE